MGEAASAIKLKLALIKCARKDVEIGAPEAVAAAAPMLGMIGQKPIQNYMKGGRTSRSWKKFKKTLRPGDVLLSTDAGFRSPWKITQAPFAGSPFYHTEVYTGRGRVAGAADVGAAQRHRTVKMENSPLADSTVIALRKKKITHKQRRKVVRKAKSIAPGPTREYGYAQAGKAWTKDIFLPKVTRKKTRGVPHCVGAICSTTASRPFHSATGINVAGKKPGDVLPTDFLRDKRFKVVGRKMEKGVGVKGVDRILRSKLTPVAARVGLGLALAGGVFGARKLLSKKSSVLATTHDLAIEQARRA